jgi:hypothetical protein
MACAAAAFVLLATAGAQARMVKQARSTSSGICLFLWPDLPRIDGWSQDTEQSFHYNCNALAPDGSTFADAETVIYARAVYKPQAPESPTLEMFIEGDTGQFARSPQKSTVAEVQPLSTADGLALRSFTFFPGSSGGEGNWEQVCYGEEGDFYLVFALSARSREGYQKALPAYKRLVGSYSKGQEDDGAK